MPDQRNNDDALLSMEWPDADRYESLDTYNDRTGRALSRVDYDRLRTLTNAPAPRPRTSKEKTMAEVAGWLR